MLWLVKGELEIKVKVSGHVLMEGTSVQENKKIFHEDRSSYRDLYPGPQEYEVSILQLKCDVRF